MKNINSQVLRKTFAFSLVRFTLVRFVLVAILIPALLIGSAFTFGGSNLQAQTNGNSKLGFFVGIVYLNGFKVDSTKTTKAITNTATGYRVKDYSAITSEIIATADDFYNTQSGGYHHTGIEALFEKSCKEKGVTEAAADGRTYFYDIVYLESFDAGTSKDEGTSVTTTGDGPGTILHSGRNIFPTGVGNDEQDTNYCYSYFYGVASQGRSIPTFSAYSNDKVTEDSAPVSQVTNSSSSKGDSISGIGLQFSFRWEKWRASLTHFTGSGGANELANTLVMADYFVNENFFVGGGLASMKLQNSLTSGSATSPAIQIGYKKNLTPNLFFNFGLTKYISGVSLIHTNKTENQTAPIPTGITFKPKQTKEGDSAVVGVSRIKYGSGSLEYFNATYIVDDGDGSFRGDYRTQVTQVHSRTVNIEEMRIPVGATETTTKSDAELKAPLVISISFHLSF